MLPWSTVRGGQGIANIRGNASFELWMEVHGTVKKDTARYLGVVHISLRSG